MKKTLILGLILVLVLIMLAACGGSSDTGSTPGGNESADSNPSGLENGGVENPEPAKQDARVIKPSELIALEDAGTILGLDLEVYEELDKPEQFGGLRSVYEYDDGEIHTSPTYMFQINIYQNELLDEKSYLDSKMKAQGGISFYNNSLKEGLELINAEEDPMKTIWIDGIGDWAAISRSPIHTINFAYDTYSLGITITGQPTDVSRSKEEESAWKVEKLIEAAMLAVERLEALV